MQCDLATQLARKAVAYAYGRWALLNKACRNDLHFFCNIQDPDMPILSMESKRDGLGSANCLRVHFYARCWTHLV